MIDVVVLATALVLSANGQTGPRAERPPASVVGTWDVTRVAVDRQDTLHQDVHEDDPRLLGRALIITPGAVNFAYDKKVGCAQSNWRPQQSTWGALIGKGFPRPETGGRGVVPVPKDFGLKVAGSQKVTAYSFCPSKAAFPGDRWIAVFDDGGLAFRYDSQVLLILERRATTARPSPSFDCAQATSPTEKAICANFELSSLDRSVALAFRQALRRQGDGEHASLRQTQKDWLKTRDECGDKVDCLDDKLSSRIDELAFY